MKKLILLTLVTLSLGVAQAEVVAMTMGEAINKAGRQRMLTQRMIKSYALAGMKIKPGASDELRDAVTLFDTQLTELTKFSGNAAERAQVRKISLLWGDLKGELATTPTLNKASELNDLAELLLQESHQLVLMLERRAGSVKGKLVNMAGRQRMLSQRIAKAYLLETWGLSGSGLAEQYKSAVDQFSKALRILSASQVNTTDVRAELRQVNKNWRIFGISNFSQKYNTRVPSLVVRSMDKILGQMNRVTGLYAAL